MAKSAQQRYLEKVVGHQPCACGCDEQVAVKKYATFPSYVKRFGEDRYIDGHQPIAAAIAARAKNLRGRRGPGTPRWKGGHQRKDGYRQQGDLLEHRVVAEKALGRPLCAGEIVHHEDENRANNAEENLEVMTASEHGRLHAAQRERDALGRFI